MAYTIGASTATEARIIVVSGYGSMISSAVARRFGHAGFKVALVARTEAKLTAAVRALSAEGIVAGAFPCDLSDVTSVAPMLDRVRASLGGRIAVLHWNAAGPESSLDSASSATMQVLLDINVRSLLRAVQHLRPLMRGDPDAAVLVTAGASALPSDYQAERAVAFGIDAKAVAQEGKRALVRLLRWQLGAYGHEGEGIFVGEVVVAAVVVARLPAAEHQLLKVAAGDVAEAFYSLWRRRPAHDYSITIGPGGALEETDPRVCRLLAAAEAGTPISHMAPALGSSHDPSADEHSEMVVGLRDVDAPLNGPGWEPLHPLLLLLGLGAIALFNDRIGAPAAEALAAAVALVSNSLSTWSFARAAFGTAWPGCMLLFYASAVIAWARQHRRQRTAALAAPTERSLLLPTIPRAAAAVLVYYGTYDAAVVLRAAIGAGGQDAPAIDPPTRGFPMEPYNHHVALFATTRLLSGLFADEVAISLAGWSSYAHATVARLANSPPPHADLVQQMPGLLVVGLHVFALLGHPRCCSQGQTPFRALV